jgi:hypothetical protein
VLLASLAPQASLLEALLLLDSTPLLDDKEAEEAASNFCDTHAKANLVQYDITGYKREGRKISAAFREMGDLEYFSLGNHCYDQGWRLVMLNMTSGL